LYSACSSTRVPVTEGRVWAMPENPQVLAVACPVGYYQPLTSGINCTACPAGSYSNTTTSSQCTACASGYFSATAGFTQCDTCVPGHFEPANGSQSCKPCARGQFVKSAASIKCVHCPQGQYNQGTGNAEECMGCLDPASALFAIAQMCELCIAGTYSLMGGGCSGCPGGYYSGSPGASMCEGCGAGFFCSPGAVSPVACEDPTKFCPRLSSAPVKVGSGNFSTCTVALDGDDSTNSTGDAGASENMNSSNITSVACAGLVS
jgi:hypothetical protein